MLNRVFLLVIAFVAVLSLGLWAQENMSGFVLFEDGERIEFKEGTDGDLLESLINKLLDSPKNGHCEVSSNGEVAFKLDKTGDQVVLQYNKDQTETLTVAEVKANFVKAKAQGQLMACKSNLKNISTALEMYYVDHEENFPDAIGKLTPDYLRIIPTCPVAGTDTYSATYKQLPAPFFYQIQCTGDHSKVGLQAGLPAYNGEQGIVEQKDELK